MLRLSRRGVSPVIAIVLLLMMTVAAAGAAYFWLTTIQSRMQESSRKSIENIMEATGRRVTAQATLCKPTYPYKGLVGYWMMDDYNSTGIFDVSENNNFGTFEGTAFGTDNITGGQVGKSLEFDGSDDYVEVPDDNSLDVTTQLTISAWVKTPSTYKYRGIAERGDISNDEGYSLMGHWGDWCTNCFHLYIGNTTNRFKVKGTLTLHEWSHITVTYDGSQIRMYVGGSFQNNQSANLEIKGEEGDLFRIGEYWNGTLDELHIYHRALSENEIQELYDAENHSARRRIDVTVRNIGSEKIPKATWVANLKQDGTTVETDAYNASSIGTGELKTLKFYFKNFKPNTEYTIELQGTGTSTTVSC